MTDTATDLRGREAVIPFQEIRDRSGHGTVAVAFQEGKVLGVVFIAVGAGTVDTAVAEAFAAAQNQKIRSG